MAPCPAPDSPRSSQSPPPSGFQGDLELELLGLANALYNLGTTVINDSTKERDKPGGGKQVGLRVCADFFILEKCLIYCVSHRNEVIGHLATVDDMAQHVSTMIPMQVLADIDNSRNPMQLTRERLERAATENQFMNGKIAAIDVSLFIGWTILILILHSPTANIWMKRSFRIFLNSNHTFLHNRQFTRFHQRTIPKFWRNSLLMARMDMRREWHFIGN